MFDIGWSEMVVIALLTLIVIGPKELPRVMRTVGQWVRKAQSLAREFQRGLDDMAREADLEDAKKLLDTGRNLANPKKMVMDTLDPSGSVEDEARDLQSAVSAEAPEGKASPTAEKSSPEKSTAGEGPAKRDGDAEPPAEEPAQATIIKHPVSVAPPHSVTPPAETSGKSEAKTPKNEPGEPDGSQKSA
jgi:sec-independent protein translocase protein TatB